MLAVLVFPVVVVVAAWSDSDPQSFSPSFLPFSSNGGKEEGSTSRASLEQKVLVCRPIYDGIC